MIKRFFSAILVIICVFLLGFSIYAALQTPSNDRDWESGFSPLTSVDINEETGDVTFNNVRDWRYNENETLSWDYISRTVNINDIDRVWYQISKPKLNAIDGHVFFTFDFKNSEPLVLSIEARREKGESFNGLYGIFRKYEIMYMWGTENDFLVMRPVAYDKAVVMYPIKIDNKEAKILFTDLIQRTQELENNPQWYNTLLHNCTNTFYQHVNKLAPGTIPFSITQWAVGLSDKTIMNLGYFDTDIRDLAELRNRYYVSDIVKSKYNDDNFSQELRDYLEDDRNVIPIIDNGVVGNFSILAGNCMPDPSRVDTNCTKTISDQFDIYFFNIDTLKSQKVTTTSKGDFSIELENGTYYAHPDAGWGQGKYTDDCMSDINNCSESDKKIFSDYIESAKNIDNICSTENESWNDSGTGPCLIKIQDIIMNLEMVRVNIAS